MKYQTLCSGPSLRNKVMHSFVTTEYTSLLARIATRSCYLDYGPARSAKQFGRVTPLSRIHELYNSARSSSKSAQNVSTKQFRFSYKENAASQNTSLVADSCIPNVSSRSTHRQGAASLRARVPAVTNRLIPYCSWSNPINNFGNNR